MGGCWILRSVRGSTYKSESYACCPTSREFREFTERAAFIYLSILLSALWVEFIFNHLTVDGVDVEESARVNSDNFFENVLYNQVNLKVKNDAIYFSRGLVGKKINMVGK